MKIGFVNFTNLVYSVNTPYEEPLGGSESAMCYLAESLAKLGHEIVLFCGLPKSFKSRGVWHEPKTNLTNSAWQKLDFLIIQNTPFYGLEIKPYLGKKTKLIFWTQHAPDQQAVACLKDKERWKVYDGLIMISRWQMEEYINTFGIDKKKCFILRNAISPAFENLYKEGEDIYSKKNSPPVLIYTSTPFRGLNLLISVFPAIRKAIPGTTLKVFSSLKVYQATEAAEVKYKELYRLCREIEGIEYIGSVSQTRLAKELSKALIFTYPNSFPETSCISAMEAMAAGCQIITSSLGALPETTAGFAKLIPVDHNWQNYCQIFLLETVAALRKITQGDTDELSDNIIRQTVFANNCYTWSKRAPEWEMWLRDLT